MYSLIADGLMIGKSGDPSLGMAGTLQMEMNSAAAWEATLLANNPRKDIASGRYTDFVLKYRNRVVFGGQCMGFRVNPDSSVTYSLCGDLSVLKESYQPPTNLVPTYQRFEQIVNNHNSLVSPKKKIIIGDIWSDDALRHWTTSYKPTWDFVAEHIEMFGGFVRIDRTDLNEKRLSWTKDGGHFNRQNVLFGDNLVSVEYSEDVNNVFSCIFAEGNDGITTTLTDPYAISKYGRIWSVQKFDADNIDDLKNLARQALDLQQIPITSISAVAIDKSFFDDSVEPISLGDFAKIRSKMHGVDGWFPVVKIQHDVSGLVPPTFVCGGIPRAITANEQKSNRFAKWVRSVSNVEPTFKYYFAVDANGEYATSENNRAKEEVMD